VIFGTHVGRCARRVKTSDILYSILVLLRRRARHETPMLNCVVQSLSLLS